MQTVKPKKGKKFPMDVSILDTYDEKMGLLPDNHIERFRLSLKIGKLTAKLEKKKRSVEPKYRPLSFGDSMSQLYYMFTFLCLDSVQIIMQALRLVPQLPVELDAFHSEWQEARIEFDAWQAENPVFTTPRDNFSLSPQQEVRLRFPRKKGKRRQASQAASASE